MEKVDYFSRRKKSDRKFDFWLLVEISMIDVKMPVQRRLYMTSFLKYCD